ncbi:MAG: lysophospholipid acyltransferase family protein [Arcticibacter sp.]
MRILNLLLYYAVIQPISMLPSFVLYRISDLLFLLFYHVVGYRKKVVHDNIEKSFPEKSQAEVKQIMDGFYRHFCDLIVESLMIFRISSHKAMSRMKFRNPELLDKHFAEGRHVIIAGGHYNNWELFAVAVDQSLKHDVYALYKPLNNLFFDEKMRTSRGKFGLRMYSIKKVKELFDNLQSQSPAAVVFATDQSPSNPQRAYWTRFLGRDTAVLFGAEKFANDYDCPVYFCTLHKIKRGYYEGEFKLVTDNPRGLAYGQLTEMHCALLEADIREKPEYWLWSHRRWKHRKPDGITSN